MGWRDAAAMNYDLGEGGSYVGNTSQTAYINLSRQNKSTVTLVVRDLWGEQLFMNSYMWVEVLVASLIGTCFGRVIRWHKV